MKGFAFSVEAALAILILVSFTIFVSSLSFSSISEELAYERFHHISQDISELFANTKVRDARNLSKINEFFNEGILTEDDLNKSLLDVVGSLWANGSVNKAKELVDSIMGLILPQNFGYEILMDDSTISNNSVPKKTFLSNSRFIVSGYAVGKPIEGYVAKASLKTIKSKTTSSYAYFGGFVGQGNLTVKISDIPSDANLTNVYLEASFGDNFSLYINGNFCKNFEKTPEEFSVDSWYINDTFCLGNITKGGENYFQINFSGDEISKKYVAGGFIKVSYQTSKMIEPITGEMNYSFPGIDGVINHYDSFYVPGNITSMKIYLHFLSNFSTYLTIGNVTVFNFSGSDTPQEFEIDNSTLSSMLNYSEISLKTVPLRLGVEALNLSALGNADVILITDLSGSMNWDMTSENTGVERGCDDPNLYKNDTKRLSLAKCLDKDFIDIILSTPGNRVGLSAFYADTVPPYKGRVQYRSLTSNATALKEEVDTYWARGGTCICCAINNAYNILNLESNASRKKYIVVMSDGIPTHQCGSSGINECQGTRDGTPGNEGLWLGWGAGCYGGLEDCAGVDCKCAMDNANWSSCRARINLNATVYSIGFGPVSGCGNANWTLHAIADCGNGEYYFSGDALQLAQIYQTIAQQIVNASLIRQALNVSSPINTTLFTDSFISFNFTPKVVGYEYGEISLKIETPYFNGCNDSFFVPAQFTVDDIGITSYSSDYWTNNLFINNSAFNWKNVFNLSEYGTNYTRLGDPYIIKFPAEYVKSNETNQINLTLGLSASNLSSNCSNKNRAIYLARLKGFTSYSSVFPKVQGKNVTVYFDRDYDGYADGYTYVAVGKDLPNFNPNPISVEELNETEDSIDYAFLQLLSKLNFVVMPFNTGRPGNQTNPIDLVLGPEIDVDTIYIPGIYSLWGPSVMEVRVWI